MRRRIAIGLVSLIALTLAAGCSWRDVRDLAVDATAPPNTSDLIRSVEHTAEEISDEEQAQRVEELSAEYEEFLRESNADSDDEEDEERSIIMVDPEERY